MGVWSMRLMRGKANDRVAGSRREDLDGGNVNVSWGKLNDTLIIRGAGLIEMSGAKELKRVVLPALVDPSIRDFMPGLVY